MFANIYSIDVRESRISIENYAIYIFYKIGEKFETIDFIVHYFTLTKNNIINETRYKCP